MNERADDDGDYPMQTSVTLFLATAGNLRCHYCYAPAGEQRGIDFVLANAVAIGSDSIAVYSTGGANRRRSPDSSIPEKSRTGPRGNHGHPVTCSSR